LEALDPAKHWHVRKEITLGTIFAILAQTIILVSVFVSQGIRIEALERDQVRLDRVAVIETRLNKLEDNVDRLENRTSKTIDDIYVILRRLEDRLLPQQSREQGNAR